MSFLRLFVAQTAALGYRALSLHSRLCLYTFTVVENHSRTKKTLVTYINKDEKKVHSTARTRFSSKDTAKENPQLSLEKDSVEASSTTVEGKRSKKSKKSGKVKEVLDENENSKETTPVTDFEQIVRDFNPLDRNSCPLSPREGHAQRSAEWYAARDRLILGSSTMACAVGVSPFVSKLKFWRERREAYVRYLESTEESIKMASPVESSSASLLSSSYSSSPSSKSSSAQSSSPSSKSSSMQSSSSSSSLEETDAEAVIPPPDHINNSKDPLDMFDFIDIRDESKRDEGNSSILHRGSFLENHAKRYFEKKTGLTIQDMPLVMAPGPYKEWIGVSPDGIIRTEDGEEILLEIKVPSTMPETIPQHYHIQCQTICWALGIRRYIVFNYSTLWNCNLMGGVFEPEKFLAVLEYAHRFRQCVLTDKPPRYRNLVVDFTTHYDAYTWLESNNNNSNNSNNNNSNNNNSNNNNGDINKNSNNNYNNRAQKAGSSLLHDAHYGIYSRRQNMNANDSTTRISECAAGDADEGESREPPENPALPTGAIWPSEIEFFPGITVSDIEYLRGLWDSGYTIWHDHQTGTIRMDSRAELERPLRRRKRWSDSSFSKMLQPADHSFGAHAEGMIDPLFSLGLHDNNEVNESTEKNESNESVKEKNENGNLQNSNLSDQTSSSSLDSSLPTETYVDFRNAVPVESSPISVDPDSANAAADMDQHDMEAFVEDAEKCHDDIVMDVSMQSLNYDEDPLRDFPDTADEDGNQLDLFTAEDAPLDIDAHQKDTSVLVQKGSNRFNDLDAMEIDIRLLENEDIVSGVPDGYDMMDSEYESLTELPDHSEREFDVDVSIQDSKLNMISTDLELDSDISSPLPSSSLSASPKSQTTLPDGHILP